MALLALWVVSAWAGGTAAFAPGRVIIKLSDDAPKSVRASIMSELNAWPVKTLPGANAEVWEISGYDTPGAVSKYRFQDGIEYIEPDYLVHACEVPNDPMFAELYGLHNTGQTGGTAGADISAVNAWDVFTGTDDVIVVVIDTGFDYTHEDLAENAWTNPAEVVNGLDDDGNGFVDDIHGWDFVNNDNDPMDDHGHGTHCSGTIGAVGNNAIGVAGVNWDVSIMGVKFLSSAGSGYVSDAILAIDYALTIPGVKVMNNSWGNAPYSMALEDAIQRTADRGVLFVCAAGNYVGDTDAYPSYPACFTTPNVMSIAATDHGDNLAGFSAFGQTTVDLAAPGDDIMSTTPGNSYGELFGTSMAAPHVSGAAALIWGRFPAMGYVQVKALIMNSVDPVAALDGLCVTGGRLNVFTCIAESDSNPPAAVDDLVASDATSSTVSLDWTATGDDGTAGTAAYYDVRYSTTPIDEDSFFDADVANGAPDPGPPETAESMTVGGLEFSTPYYFALKVLDEYANYSPVSNLATAVTLGAPEMAVNPDSLAEVLPPGGASTQTLSIGNVGAGTLDFQLSEPVLILGSSVPGEYAIYGKDDLDPRIGSPVTEGAGGPDMTGYRWIDSDQPGGPVFNWVDISGMGTLIPMSGDDENTGPYPMGFDFEFYGNTFNSFRVCTNGFLSFTSVLPPYSNQPIPNAMAPGNMIAPFWDDLNFSGADRCYYLNDGDRLIVSWHDVPHYGFGGPYTFQVILYPDCGIVFQYLSMAEPTGSATVGIQNDAGSDGLQVAYNTSYIHDNLAIKISRMPQWVTISPNEGRVWHGGEMGLTVTYDAAGLASGVYEGTIGITSNDATDPLMNIPVTLIVGWTPAAYADFEPNTLNLSSRGRWVKMELGVPPEYDAGSFLPETAFLTTPGGGIVSPPEAFDVIGPDRSGLYAVMLKFNRGDVEDILPEGDSVEVMVAGELERETYLAGRDTIRCIRPKLIHPNGGEVFSCDHEARIIVSWETPANFDVDTYAVHFSADAGESWEEVVTGITTQSAIVDVPFPETEEALFRIYALKGEEIVGYDSSDDVFSISLTGAGVEDEVKPTVFMLRPNVPNPFSGTTSLQFDIPKEAHVNLSVYNVRGRKVKNLLDQVLTPGTYNIGWDGRSTYGDRVASGVYYYKIVAGGWNKTRAMVIVK